MARLIACDVCENKISSEALVCTKCGHPHKNDKDNKRDYTKIYILAGITFLVILLANLGYLEPIINFIFKR